MKEQVSFGKDFGAEKEMLLSVGADSKPRTIEEAWGKNISEKDYRQELNNLNKEDLQKICVASKELPKEDRNSMINSLVKKFKKSRK